MLADEEMALKLGHPGIITCRVLALLARIRGLIMPIQTVERIQKREAVIRKSLTDKGEGMAPGVRKRKVKQLKRAQRKRRELVAVATRRAGKPAKSES